MDLNGIRVGFAMTGSFCTFAQVLPQVQNLVDMGSKVTPIMSETAAGTDTRFGSAEYFRSSLEEMTGTPVISTIKDAEPIGPKKLLDILVIAPCTGNTISKLANGITDSSVCMAAKAHLRNGRPLVIAVSTNDALGTSARNIGQLLNAKNIYLVPFRQDDPVHKQTSMVADMQRIAATLEMALEGKQIQPLVIT